MSNRTRRLVVVPLLVFLAISAGVFTLAKLAPAKPEEPKAGSVTIVVTGDAARGRTVYANKCAGCHGPSAEGGIGPKLAGVTISLPEAKAQIDNGGGAMPAGLVKDTDEADLLAYLDTIFAPAE